jgi:ABC-type hemin transport system substrate-binding protein
MPPTRSDLINAVALAGACALAALIGYHHGPTAQAASGPPGVHQSVPSADGAVVLSGDYRRIISLDPAIDDALAEMGQARRLYAISTFSMAHASRARLLQEVPRQLPAGASLEDILSLHGDLVLVTSASDPQRSRRLRSAGVVVFDCGNEATAAQTAAAVRAVAAVIELPGLGEDLSTRFLERLARVADPRLPTPGACYVADYNGSLYGGAQGTNFHELIQAAGYRDLASEHGWKDYPVYHIEDLVVIAPQVVVTARGMGAGLCALPGSERVPALRDHRIIEIDPDLLMITGIGELEAAEAVAHARSRLP